jgi:hypothetical protein
VIDGTSWHAPRPTVGDGGALASEAMSASPPTIDAAPAHAPHDARAMRRAA